jgi:hypothetical protein
MSGLIDRSNARATRVFSLAACECRPCIRKLPEMMLVLPLLIDAFPHAKVVHLTRHPVSSSLRRTHMTSRLTNAVGAAALPAAYRYSNRDPRQIGSDEPYLHNAYAWNFQVARVVRYAWDVLGEPHYLEPSTRICVPSRIAFSPCPIISGLRRGAGGNVHPGGSIEDRRLGSA